jgi:DNA-binding transcriptional MerR regulator
MELISIKQVSLDYGISRQMLYYYEEIGLIKSIRQNNYTYRFYDENAIKRIQQIIILRKLQIPMKQIKNILNNQNAVTVIEIFKQNISELDEQITALSVVRSILVRFVEELQGKSDIRLKLDLLNDKTMLAIVSSLSFSENKINKSPTLLETKENVTMENLNKANETLNKLKDNDVRIVYLPPMTVASAHGPADCSEGKEKKPTHIITKFARETGLLKIKPDARGMITAKYSEEYLKALVVSNSREDFLKAEPPGVNVLEAWVSIPDDMEVKAPLTKKTFEGGLYAAHLARNESFEEARFLAKWISVSEKYEVAYERPFCNEMLNYHNWPLNYEEVDESNMAAIVADIQVDLLLPIKKIAE